jgi:lysophospholipase L1-like esterase
VKHILSTFFFLLISATLLAQIKVACIGNSITAGGYPAILQEQLGSQWKVENFGVSGTTMLRNGDHPYYTTPTYEKAKEFNPDVVVIKLGTNDSKPQNWKYKDQYASDYLKMIEELRALPSKPYIIACYPVPAFSSAWDISDNVIKNEIMPLVDSIAKTTNIKVINLYKALSGHQAQFPDGIHPNKEGSTVLAKAVAKKLKKWRKKVTKRPM